MMAAPNPSHERRRPRTVALRALSAALWALGCGSAEAEPVKVRLPEGAVHGLLVLRSPAGPALAHGELVQTPKGGALESRLTFAFADGSFHEETVLYSQDGVFQLQGYRLVQRGPAFPTSVELSFDRKTGRYQVRQRERSGEEATLSGRLDMPADLYNGLTIPLLRNLPRGARASVQFAAFTPEPRLLTMHLGPEGEDTVRLGNTSKTLTRHLVRLEIGGLTGVVATLIGKKPPDLRYWMLGGEVPAFVRFEGPLFFQGPVWRIELTTVEWPR